MKLSEKFRRPCPQRVTVAGTALFLTLAVACSGGGGGGATPLTLVSITVSLSETGIAPGTTTSAMALGRFSNGSQRAITSGLSWASSDPSVATVGPTGLVTGANTAVLRTASISATDLSTGLSSSGSGGDATVTVSPVVGVTVSPSAATIAEAMTQQYSARAQLDGGFSQDVTSFATWRSSTAAASVSDTGLATALSAGSPTISAEIGGTTATAVLTIQTLSTIAITPVSTTVLVGATQDFNATGTLSGGGTIDLSGLASWLSSDALVATIDAGGTATGVSEGVVTISATFNGVSSTLSGGDASLQVDLRTGFVSALYPLNGGDWNDYVRNDGPGVFSARDSACLATVDGPGYRDCLHGGEMRAVEVSGKSTCSGLTAVDDLAAFDWACTVLNGTVTMVSRALKKGRGLSTLLDFSPGAAGWKNNVVTVSDAGGAYLKTQPAQWWGNNVIEDNDGGSLSQGNIYLTSAVAPTGVYTIAADRVAFAVGPQTVLSGTGLTGEDILSVTNAAFIWLEGTVDATGDNAGVILDNVAFSVLRNVRVSGATSGTDRSGLVLRNASNNLLLSIVSVNNAAYGLALRNSTNHSVSEILVSNNGNHGVLLTGSTGNSLLFVTAFNNGGLVSSSGSGVQLDNGSDDNLLANVTTMNNFVDGLRVVNATHNLFLNVAAGNNGFSVTGQGDGVALRSSTSHETLRNLALADNKEYGVRLSGSSTNRFTGLLKNGTNGFAPCRVENSPTLPGLINGTCTDTGTNGSSTYSSNLSDAVLSIIGSGELGQAFIGKVTSNDTVNPDDSNGAQSRSAISAWVGFDNDRRGWGINGGVFPALDNRNRCVSGDVCRIWDWSLDAGGTVFRDAITSVPTGTDTVTHDFGTMSVTFLKDAVEMTADGIGDDDGLCETGETCLLTPNIGSYQGHGGKISAGTFSDGTITGVTLLKQRVNGR